MSITPDSISKFVDNSICQLLSIEASLKYTRDTPLMQLGLSSLQLMELRALLAWEFSIELAPTFFFQAITAQDAIDYLIKNKLETYKDWLYEIQWKETNAPKPQKLIPNKLWLIFTEKNQSIGQTLFEELTKNEQLCLFISPGIHFEKVDEHHYTIDPNSPHDFTQLLLSISALPKLAAVVYLWGYQGLQTEATFAAIETYMKRSCGGLVNLVNSMATAHVPEEAKLWIVTQSIVSDGNDLSLVQTSLNALSKVIREEYSKSNSSFLALDSEDTNNRQVELLLEELAGKSSEPQIAWKKGTRRVARMVPTTIQSVQNVRFSDKATYLIAGGHRPLGLRLARWHIEHGAKTLVLLDENPLTPQIEAEIQELKAQGADIYSYAVPFDNLAILQLVFNAIQTNLPPLKGVIHSAGVVDNDLLLHMDWSRFEQTHRLKIAGSWNLHALTEKLDLDHFILFSAAMADLAPLGKASNVTGNTFLDALSYYRKAKNLPSLTIDWAPWESKLVVLHHLIDNSLSSRMKLISIEEGLKVLESLFYTNKTQVMAVQVEWSMLLSRLIRENPLFEEIAKKFELIPADTHIVAESNEPIAIIGMACRFPGAENYHQFWENLTQNIDSVVEIPADRWDWHSIYGDPKTESGKTNIKWGGFIKDMDTFDPLFFNISPKEAAYIDPQHRIFLQCAWHAMEDAGYSSEKVAGHKVGVFAGVSKNDYAELMREDHAEILPYISTGTVHSILTNRVSYILDLHGPSESIDTACSSALVALHSAVRCLRNGECTLAFVGGVNALISPTMYISHTRSGMLSSDGQCKTFDASANGYVRGEGVGVVLLKPLKEAIKDGDVIHAVIRDVAVNHGGKATGLTAPNPDAQAEVVTAALEGADIDPKTVTYIEVHGTGTPLGDPIEIEGLKKAYKSVEKENHIVLGAVKTNIGHLESASGIAGLIKMTLALKYHAIPANLHFTTLNPRITLGGSPFTLATTYQEWNPVNMPRRGGLSSFGMGGANAHVVLEESTRAQFTPISTTKPLLFPVSAMKGRLKSYLNDLIAYLEKNTAVDITSFAYTLQTGRNAFEEKAIFVASSTQELITKMSQFVQTGSLDDTLDDLAKQWLSGSKINWEKEWTTKPLRLSGIPGYPFNKVRCWYEPGSKKESTPNSLIATDAFFLRDHIVAGKSILPGVMYLELARSASNNPLVKTIKNVNWIAPIEAHGSHIQVDVKIDNDSHFSISEGGTLKCTGELAFADSSKPETIDIQKIIQSCTHKKQEDEIYQSMKELGLSQGPSLRVLKEFYWQGNIALGKLVLNATESLEEFVLHPSLMDGVFQTVVAHHFSEHPDGKQQYLPYALGSVTWHKPLEQEVWAYVEELPESTIGSLLKYRMSMLSPKGEELVKFEGFLRRPLKTTLKPRAKELYYKDVWEEKEAQATVKIAKTLLLFSENQALTDALKEKLPNIEVTCVTRGSNFKKTSPNHFEVNAANPADYQELFTDIKNKDITLSQIVYAWDSYDLQPLLYLTQSLIKSRCFDSCKILYVYSSSTQLGDAQHAMIAGFGRTLIFENPKIQLISVETKLLEPEERASIIAAELQDSGSCPLLEVSYVDGKRKVRTVVPAPDIASYLPKQPLLKQGGTYLLTGGAGGLGQIFAKYLADTYRTNLILVGRSELNDTIREDINRLEKTAKSVHYLQADVTDAESLKKAFEKLPKELQKLNGVIHAAGIKKDSFILKKDPASFAQVITTKVKGALALDALTKDMTLDFMLLFSSIASLIPNQGQSDYAAANSFLDRFARMRRKKRPGVTLAINWPLWASGGMQVTAQQEEHLSSVFGMAPLPTEVGIEAFEHLLSYAQEFGIDQAIVISGDTAKIMSAFGSIKQDEAFPLIDSVIQEHDLGFAKKIFHTTQSYVAGFSIDGKASVPGACFLEMARQGACTLYGQEYATVFNNYWPAPLILEDAQVEAKTKFTPTVDCINFEITTTGPGGKEVIHATGSLASSPRLSKPEAVDYSKKIAQATNTLTSDAFYETIHKNADLRLKGAFRPVQKLYVLENEAIARLELSKDISNKNFTIQPIIFTGLEQSLLVYTALTHVQFHPAGMRLMPVSIESVDIYAPFGRTCWIHIAAKKEPSASNKIQRFDATLYDDAGQIVAFVCGNTMRITAEQAKPKANILQQAPAKDAEAYVKKILSNVLGIKQEEIDSETDFERYGVTSQMIVELNSLLEKDLGPVSKTLFFEYANVKELACYLEKQLPAAIPEITIQAPSQADIASQKPQAPTVNSETYLKKILSAVLGIKHEEIDSETDFERYGVTSQMIVEINTLLEKDLGPVSKTLFFEYANVKELACYLDKLKTTAEPAALTEKTPEPPLPEIVDTDIAIIGMSGRFPGAQNLDEYWSNLASGIDSVSKNPLHQELYHSDLLDQEILSCKWGGSIADVESFDPAFFGIAPKEGALIDPQERLFLKVSWEAIQDAGWNPKEMTPEQRKIGVYVGVIWQDYQLLALEETLKGHPVVVSSLLYSIANRVSYTFNFTGPSLSVDTACSSSLTALHLACESLILGHTKAAIVGGVNLNLHPMKYAFLNNYSFLSSEGKCRSYGEGGDGYVPGEGVGAVVLKPYKQAIKDGDPVYAIIKGSAINHGGKTRGYTVPNPTLQSEVVLSALEEAHINPRDISYVEGHGTGTALGDPVEIRGLELAYSKYTDDKQYCAIGSVKSNIGHLEAAAGIASIIKVILQMEHKTKVPSLHSETLNKNIDFTTTPFYVQHKLEPWMSDRPFLAAVSSFGAGGSYAHVLIEQVNTPNEAIKKRKKSPAFAETEGKYWIEQSKKAVHPLLGQKHTTPSGDIVYDASVGPVGLEYLKDHLIYDSTIFPGAGFMEMMLSAAILGLQVDKIRLTDVNIRAPLLFTEGKDAAIQVILKPVEKGYEVAVYSQKDDCTWNTHTTANVATGDFLKDTGRIDIETFRSRCSDMLPKEELYTRLQQYGPTLGLCFQTLDKVYIGNKEAFGEVHLSPAPNGYFAHPALLDGCLQLMTASLNKDSKNVLVLPVGCDAIELYSPLSGHVFAHYQELEDTEALKSANIKIYSPSGELQAKIEGMHYRKTTEKALKEMLAQESGVADLFYEWDWQHYSIDDSKVNNPTGTWLLLGDTTITNELGSQIKSKGANCRQLTPHEYPKSREGFSQLLQKEPLSGIILAASSDAQDQLTHESIAAAQEIGTKAYLHLVQSLESLEGMLKLPLFLVASNSPEYAPLTGLFKTALIECPGVKQKLVSISTPSDAHFIFTTLFEKSQNCLYKLDEAKCFVPRLTRTKQPQALNNPIKSDATYLITGGLGGLGQAIAKWLADKNAGHIVLTGRNPADKTQLAGLEDVSYEVLDVSDEQAVASLITQLHASPKPLKGIFHLAGIVDDAMIRDQDWDHFQKIFSAKVYGTLNLHKHSNNLDLFVLFSSIASMLGNAGQSNYAAANAFMDELCEYRKKQGLVAHSISWGPWAEVGMASNLAAKHALRGLLAMAPAQAIQALEAELSLQHAHGMIAKIQWGDYIQNWIELPSFLENVMSKKEQQFDLLKEISAADTQKQASIIKIYLCSVIRTVLGLPETYAIEDEKSFFDIGLDSLMAVEVRNRLQKSIGDAFTVPSTIIFDRPTIKKLAAFLNEKLNIKEETASEKLPCVDNAIQDEIAGMSDEEALKQLMDNLNNG